MYGPAQEAEPRQRERPAGHRRRRSAIFELLDTHTEVTDAAGRAGAAAARRASIEFRDVSFEYEDARGKSALRDVSFTVAAGQTVAIVGRSGAGKTSLVNLLPRFYDVTAGAHPDRRHRHPARRACASLRDQIGMVTQETVLFDDTIASNIAYGRPGAPIARHRGRGARRARARVHPSACPRQYDTRDRRTRAAAVGRPAAAPGDRPRAAQELADPRSSTRPPRRSTPSRRRLVQDALANLMREPHLVRHRAPAVDDSARRRDHRAGARARRRGRPARRAAGEPGRRLRGAARDAVRRAPPAPARPRDRQTHDQEHDGVRVGVARKTSGRRIGVTVRSVNHRYLDVQLRLPQSMAPLEAALRALRAGAGGARAGRGGGVGADAPGARAEDRAERGVRARRWRTRSTRPARPGSCRARCRRATCCGFRRRSTVREEAPELDEAGAGPSEAAIAAGRRAGARRSRRDAARAKARCCARISTRGRPACRRPVEASPRGRPPARPALRERLARRVGELAGRPGRRPAAVAQEVVRFVARSDISEEIVRFRAHVAAVDVAVGRAGAVRPQARFPAAGDEPRSQHNRLEGRRRRRPGDRHRHQGRAREDARAGAECRVARRRGTAVRRVRAVGHGQDHGGRAARSQRRRPEAIAVVHQPARRGPAKPTASTTTSCRATGSRR